MTPAEGTRHINWSWRQVERIFAAYGIRPRDRDILLINLQFVTVIELGLQEGSAWERYGDLVQEIWGMGGA